MERRPSVISKINPANSETLSLSASQFRRRRQKTVEAVKAIHCDSHVYTSEKEQTKSGVHTDVYCSQFLRAFKRTFPN